MKKILITEDDPLMAEIYRDTFDSAGFSAEIAPDGLIAIQRFQQNTPDIMLLDLMLPKLNGVDVLKFIRTQSTARSTPVIVLSNAYVSELGKHALQEGATKLLAKNGIGMKALVEEVQRILQEAEISRTVQSASPSAQNGGNPDEELARVCDQMPQRLFEILRLTQNLGATEPSARLPCLVELYRAIHGLAGAANYANLRCVTQLCCALETLLKELNAKPQKITPSSLRTITHAIDLLTPLLQHARETQDDTIPAPLILVLDDEPISRETTCSALEYAQLRALSLDDPEVALRVLAENRFDLIFMDVQMPGMDGFEVCQRIHSTAANPNTPIVFITAMGDFDTRARSSLCGGVDFVTKPILMIEIAVKALTHLLRAHCNLASCNAAAPTA